MPKINSKGFRARFGHVVPKVIEKLPKLSLGELQGIWLNLVPHLAGRNEHETSPLAAELRDAILAEWSARARIAYDDPHSFRWPSTEISAESGGSVDNGKWQPLGMLAFLGYHVGVTHGLTTSNRRAILDAAYLATLPPLNGPSYMKEWGEPETGNRLRKIADSLAAFTRNAKRRSSVIFEAAIAQWEDDLRYLKVNYYDGKYGFGWPILSLQ